MTEQKGLTKEKIGSLRAAAYQSLRPSGLGEKEKGQLVEKAITIADVIEREEKRLGLASKSDLSALVRTIVNHAAGGTMLPVFAPSCPDYRNDGVVYYFHGYLGYGLSLLGDYQIRFARQFLPILDEYDVVYDYVVLTADVEAHDEGLVELHRAFHGQDFTTDEFMEFVKGTITSTSFRTYELATDTNTKNIFVRKMLNGQEFKHQFMGELKRELIEKSDSAQAFMILYEQENGFTRVLTERYEFNLKPGEINLSIKTVEGDFLGKSLIGRKPNGSITRSVGILTEFPNFFELQRLFEERIRARLAEDVEFAEHLQAINRGRYFNLYRRMFDESERPDGFMHRTVRTMAQYAALGQLARERSAIITSHQTLNIPSYNDAKLAPEQYAESLFKRVPVLNFAKKIY